jgi:hypothetical protein
MVIIALIAGVTTLLFFYNKQGWKVFNKVFGFSRLEINARSALEQLSWNLRQADRDLIYVGNAYNPDMIFPEDIFIDKPYLYFARPNFKEDSLEKSSYDYYLYYISKTNSIQENEDFTKQRGRIKLFYVPNQDAHYTNLHRAEWPFPPPALQDLYKIEDLPESKKIGTLDFVKIYDLSPEFELHKSNFLYDYYVSTNEFKNLFHLEINLYDQASDTNLKFENSVSPRN